jgi:hypothetical protein
MSAAPERRQPIDIEEFERRLRAPEPQSSVKDPLEELARLVAGQGRPAGDPFASIFADRPLTPPKGHHQAEARPPVEPPGAEIMDFPDLSAMMRRGFDETAPRVETGAHFEPQLEAPGAPAIGARYPEEFHASSEYEDWAQDSDARPDSDEPAPAPEARVRSKKPLYMTAAVILAGVTAIGATLAWRGGGSTNTADSIATIKAATGPNKVQPEGKQNDAPARDATLLEKGAQTPQVKKVVSRDEQPIDVNAAAKTPRVIGMSDGSASASSGAAAVPTPPPPLTRPADQTNSAFPEPKKVKTVAVRADGSIISTETAPPPPAPPQPTADLAKNATPKTANRAASPATTPAAPPVAPKPTQTAAVSKPATPAAKPPVAASPAPAATKPAAKPAQTAAVQQDDQADDNADATPAKPAAGGSGYGVQLAAAGSESEARATAQRLGEKYSGALAGRRPSVVKASDKAGVWRIRVGGLSRDGATSACEKIKAAGGACYIVH